MGSAQDALAFKIQHLEAFFKDHPESVTDEEEAKCVYSAIETHLNPRIRDLNEAGEPIPLPPASMVIYTARRFAHPYVRPPDIPSMLHILENVEALRMQAVEEAGELLLEASEGKRKLKRRKALEGVADKNNAEAQRVVYLKVIVLDLVRQCLCYLWKKHDSAQLWRLMRETFPSLFIKDKNKRFEDTAWKAFVHTGMTKKDRELFHTHGKVIKGLLADMKTFDKDWGETRASEDDDDDSAERYERAFEERFVKEMDDAQTLLALRKYLDRAEKMVNTIEDALNS